MGSFVPILALVIVGIGVLAVGLIFIFRRHTHSSLKRADSSKLFKSGEASRDGQICPLCSSKLMKSDKLETTAFLSITGGKDRIMHIKGCVYCLSKHAERSCPVCKEPLGNDDIVVARMFERGRDRNSHVHILGCNKCRKVAKL
jgi:hypothetical protein